jgi:polyisoprenoid-binding protein YceI
MGFVTRSPLAPTHRNMFMLLRLSMMLGLVVSFCGLSSAQDLKLDLEKSKIDFVGKKPAGETHKGGFKEFTADAKVDFDSPDKSTLLIEIKTESLWSDSDKLTTHLKNPDFFNVEKFPKIKFETTSVVAGEGEATLTGKMTMLDKTVEVKVPVKVEMTDSNLVLIATFKLDRTKWGMNFGRPNISDEVDITATLHYKR